MLNTLINILKSATVSFSDGNLILENYIFNNVEIKDKINDLVLFVYDENDHEVFLDDVESGTLIKIEFDYYKLKQKGYFQTIKDFINTGSFKRINGYYIAEIDYSDIFTNSDIPEVILKYNVIFDFLESLASISKYFEIHGNYKTLFITCEKNIYSTLNIELHFEVFNSCNMDSKEIVEIISTLNGFSSEKKILYINELIDYINRFDERIRFQTLLFNFSEYFRNCMLSYEYFLQNFSLNKLKTELNNTTLEYYRKIQSVINEAQSKLIAIPAAFVIAISTIDINNISNLKNYLILISLYVFATLIEIFIKNQNSSLSFIEEGVKDFKLLYKDADIIQNEVFRSFEMIDKELIKQQDRLFYIQLINWGIPISISITFISILFYEFLNSNCCWLYFHI